MPRNPDNRNEFIAGKLPIIKIGEKQYYVDGRMQQVRNINDHSDYLQYGNIQNNYDKMSDEDIAIVDYEFFGTKD